MSTKLDERIAGLLAGRWSVDDVLALQALETSTSGSVGSGTDMALGSPPTRPEVEEGSSAAAPSMQQARRDVSGGSSAATQQKRQDARDVRHDTKTALNKGEYGEEKPLPQQKKGSVAWNVS